MNLTEHPVKITRCCDGLCFQTQAILHSYLTLWIYWPCIKKKI